MQFNKTIKNIKEKCNTHQKQASLFLLVTIPFMLLMILTHKIVFIEFGAILFAFALYNIKKIVDLNEEINTIKELSLKLQKNNLKNSPAHGPSPQKKSSKRDQGTERWGRTRPLFYLVVMLALCMVPWWSW